MINIAGKTEPNYEKLNLLHEIGYTHVEVHTTKDIIDDCYSTAILNSFPFTYAVHAPFDCFDQSVLDFAITIGAKVINTHKVITDDWLRVLTSKAKAHNIMVTVENEGFPESFDPKQRTIPTYGAIKTGSDFIRLVNKLPEVRLCCDIEHCNIKSDFPWMLYQCKEHLGHIHLSGWDSEVRKHHEPVYKNVELLKEVLLILECCNYSGFVVCEHFLHYNTKEVWKKTLQVMQQAIIDTKTVAEYKKKCFNKFIGD